MLPTSERGREHGRRFFRCLICGVNISQTGASPPRTRQKLNCPRSVQAHAVSSRGQMRARAGKRTGTMTVSPRFHPVRVRKTTLSPALGGYRCLQLNCREKVFQVCFGHSFTFLDSNRLRHPYPHVRGGILGVYDSLSPHDPHTPRSLPTAWDQLSFVP